MRRYHWWRPAYAGFGCGPDRLNPEFRSFIEGAATGFFFGGFGEAGPFGVKRPLRFLAYKLGLDENQVAELARILEELKTERAQAAVDDRRTLTAFADAISGETFDQTRADEGASLRKSSSERARTAVAAALPKIHKLLRPEQRERLAYLIRTGTLVL